MKNLFFILILLSVSFLVSGQEYVFKKYSYAELYQMIEEETDTIFTLKDAIIEFDPQTDSLYGYIGTLTDVAKGREDTLIIDKELYFENVHFNDGYTSPEGITSGFYKVLFKRRVHIRDAYTFFIQSCLFKDKFTISYRNREKEREGQYRKESKGFNLISLISNNIFINSQSSGLPK